MPVAKIHRILAIFICLFGCAIAQVRISPKQAVNQIAITKGWFDYQSQQCRNVANNQLKLYSKGRVKGEKFFSTLSFLAEGALEDQYSNLSTILSGGGLTQITPWRAPPNLAVDAINNGIPNYRLNFQFFKREGDDSRTIVCVSIFGKSGSY